MLYSKDASSCRLPDLRSGAASSCHEGPHVNQPSPLPIPTSVPYFLTAGASVGQGADAGHATISVKVQNVEGAPMQGVPVTFETDQGTIDPATAVTLADGTARALLIASVRPPWSSRRGR